MVHTSLSKVLSIFLQISLAYSTVSVDSVDSVDTVNSIRINETKVETTIVEDREPAVAPMESLITRRSSSARVEPVRGRVGGNSNIENGGRGVSAGAPPVITRPTQPPPTKKKPEVKAKPKIAKVIPVVKSVSTTVIKPNGRVGFGGLPQQLHRLEEGPWLVTLCPDELSGAGSSSP